MLKNILTYTEEMRRHDELWENEKYDNTIMEELFHQITEEAKANGYEGTTDFYQLATCYGFCKPLIEHLEERISMLRLIDYVENNEDLFDQRGLSKEAFYNEIMGFIDMAYESQSPVRILTVKDSLEEIVAFIIDEFVSEELTNDKLYDIFTEEDIYVYKLNETNQYILIKK